MSSFGFEGDPNRPIQNLYYGNLAAVDAPRDTTPPVISATRPLSFTGRLLVQVL